MVDSISLKSLLAMAVILSGLFSSCGVEAAASEFNKGGGVGVLLVNHGSHSPRWRKALLDLEGSIRDQVLAMPGVQGVRTAFMEYTEPSIATQLRAFDKAGVEDVLMIPIFLTVSSHSFDDIPNIIGTKDGQVTRVGLDAEGIERYTPRAKVTLAPLLDFSETMRRNLARRVKSMSTDVADEGVVLVAYGSTPYEKEWSMFMDDMRSGLEEDLGINTLEYSWCGHIVHYSPEPTAKAIERVLAKKERALVVPVLVAVDEDFQLGMIQKAADRTYAGGTVDYRGDSILPDANIEDWVIGVVRGHLAQ